MSSFRVLGRNSDRNTEPEGNENEFENPINLIPFPPSRTPLNTISDPSQNPAEFQDTESDSRVKFEGSRLRRLSDRKIEAWNYGTPRIGVRGKPHSEPNSAQSTPARSVPKVFSGVPTGTCSVIKPPRDIGTRGGGSSSKVSRRISVAPSEPSMDVPHFELVEDSSFWMDHNVQVLIRIRPISTAEKVLQGKFRCLRQDSAHTLTWLGNPETRFTFDHVACETISQEKLFMVAGLPMVENCMSGYNSCMFAYGQTGSGKTYTMMGEIHEMDGNLNKDCGMTPRIFEYLFTRIRAEEENRRDENLKYSCKCSFLEIYNEQITDLLEPSSTNLQLREDARKGVYVENLKEYEVTTVKDVVELLLQGAANRKMAATHMNSESSRSHSVFTCVIESRWDMDSTTHLRFGRLNLVDLAGSERQKSSGAEGDRLKEAANINKSLSTLGLVIMTLVDVAHGKQRHVPYRDSRLTFLLQDSLGGNSKTTIIANISPSTCSANETLSTLKFAQRAKLIQNNAKVNEGASGDVMALQRQIQQLKDQLTYILKHQKPSRSLSLCLPNLGQSQLGDFNETNFSSLNGRIPDCLNSTSTPKKKMKCIDTTLTGALRREKMAETAARRLEAEIEHMNRLVHQQEEDAQRTKMILRFREEKIKRLELLTDGLVSADEYLMEENSALYEEIQLLQARIDRNPELTRFALENIRLLEQLRMYEDFYEQGERETLLTEVSELRDQLMENLEGYHQHLEFSSRAENQDKDSTKELEDCRGNLEACLQINESLTREVDELQRELNKYLNPSEAAFDSVTESLSRDAETIKQADKHSSVEIISVRTDLDDEIASYIRAEDEVLKIKNDQKMGDTLVVQLSETEKELMEARFLIEAMESEQVHLIEELDILRKENLQYVELFRNEDFGQIQSMLQHENQCEPSEWHKKTEDSGQPDALLIMEDKVTGSVLQSKLDRMNKDLEEARILIRRYQEDHASQLFHQDEVEQVRQQVEVEMAKTILHLQDNLTTLQQELQERLCVMTEENMKLRNTLMSREAEMKSLAEEWEKATIELTTFILDGSRSLEDASNQIGIIAGSFPERKYWISEHVERAAKAFIEKETTIKKLRKSLEDAQKIGLDMELKLSSLKGATLAITDVQQLENDEKDKETLQLRSQLSEKISIIQKLESKLKNKEDQIIEAEKRADAAFVVVKRLSSFPKDAQAKLAEKEIPEFKLAISVEQDKYRISDIKAEENAQAVEAIEESEEGCSNTRKMLRFKLDSARLVAEEKINTASDFLVKLEEAQATMKEADVMLNTLLKANDNAKHMTDRWKQAGKELKIERDSLIEEVQQLTTTICLQQGEYESLQGQFRSSLVEIANSVSSLETFVLQMQRDVEERFKVIYSDISSLGQDLLNCICNSRSSLEDIWSEIMEKGFALFVLYQCHMRGSSEKIWTVNSEPFFLPQREKECDSILKGANGIEEADQIEQLHYKLSNPGDILDIRYSLGKVVEYKEEELGLTLDNMISENESLKKELARKDILLKGLLFDLSLLQESTSNSKDIKDETEKMVATLTAIRDELTTKTTQLDDILVEHRKLEAQLADSEAALSLANSKLEQAEEIHDVLSNQNGELRVLVNDLFAKKDDAEEQLEEKKEVIKSLEEEILRMAFSVEEKILSSIEDIEDELRTVTDERDHLREEVISLNDKLEMANALADENEALAVEARQFSEASKIYAEQKEEEAKILERSVEELECTINVLEKKVYEMGEEVERDRFMRDDLKLELQDPIQQNMNPEYFDVERQREDQTSRHLDDRILELHESKNRIKVLEKERAELAKEIKECRNYISELVLHADAQASLFHQKYNMLEAMVREVKKDASTSTSVAIPSEKTEKSSMRPRGSSSPFRCIQGLVQQMNVEKDQELSMARLRIEELEALASRQQKEVCMLNARLAAAESMTHDVIRDLLAVKLDITNYANLIDQHEVQKLVEEAQQQTEESIAKEQEILKLRKQINDLMEERQSYIKEINQREADILAAQLKVEQLRERDHMLTAQNEMLKMDKTNLKRTVTEMVKKQFVPQNIQQRVQQTTKMKENSFSRVGNEELSKRLMHSEKLLSNVNNELTWYRKSDSRDPYNQNDEQRLRNKRQGLEDDFD